MSGAIQQDGPVVPGRPAVFVYNGTVQDGGPPGAGILSGIGITNNGGLAFGINSGVISGPYVQYGESVNADGTITISANSFNGAPAATLVYNINGVTYAFNPAGNGNVTGPTSSTNGDLVAFNGTGGNLVEDTGIPAANVVQGPSVAVDGDVAVFSGTTGKLIADSGFPTAHVVRGPALSISGDLAAFNGIGGNLIEDSNLSIAEVAAGLAALLPPIANVAALEAETSTTLPQANCYLLGYYAAGDGGAGAFYVGTTTTANGGTIINDASGRSWYRETVGEAASVRWFGAKGDGATNDFTAIAAAITYVESLGAGTVLFPPGNYRINSGLTVSTSNVLLLSEAVGAATIVFAATTGFAVTLTGTFNSGVRGLDFTSGQPTGKSAAPTAGAAILITGNGFHNFADWVTCQYTFDAIHVISASETRILHLVMRFLFGTAGVYYAGTVSLPSFRLILDDIIGDNPYVSEPSSISTQILSYAANTAFTLNQVVSNAGCVFQCVQGGTTGPSSAPTNPGSFTTQITDGSVKWQFICAQLAWVWMDNYAYSLVIDKASLVDGNWAFRMTDAADTGTSLPTWCDAFDLECDHNFAHAISLEAGYGFYLSDGWISSALTGNGIFVGDACFGEVSVGPGSRIFGCAENGILFATGENLLVAGAFIAANSEASGGTFHGVNVVTPGFFAVTDSAIGGSPGGNGVQGFGIFIGSAATDFSITTNVLTGNATGSISNNAAAGPAQIIANNVGYATQNSGSSAIPNGSTTVAVTHGLAGTPAAGGVMVTPNGGYGGAGNQWWVTAIGASTFTVETLNTVSGGAFTFSWNARLGAA